MDFGTNKTLVEIIKEGAFGGTYFRDIYLKGINFRENLFSRINFFRHFATTNFREWSNFGDFARANFRERGHVKYFSRIYFRE